MKLAVIVGGIVLMAGVALAGTLTSLGSPDTPAGQTIAPPLTSTPVQLGDRSGGREVEQRGREAEQGGREAEPVEREDEAGEDLRGPCDEAEHANDPRCTGAAVPTGEDDDQAVEAGHDRSGHDGGGEDHSGHGGDDD